MSIIKTADGWKQLGATKPIEVQDPRSRPFTQFAAKHFVNGHNALNAGMCPTCQGDVTEFRDALSLKEFGISGMCQKCQDSVFGGPL